MAFVHGFAGGRQLGNAYQALSRLKLREESRHFSSYLLSPFVRYLEYSVTNSNCKQKMAPKHPGANHGSNISARENENAFKRFGSNCRSLISSGVWPVRASR